MFCEVQMCICAKFEIHKFPQGVPEKSHEQECDEQIDDWKYNASDQGYY